MARSRLCREPQPVPASRSGAVIGAVKSGAILNWYPNAGSSRRPRPCRAGGDHVVEVRRPTGVSSSKGRGRPQSDSLLVRQSTPGAAAPACRHRDRVLSATRKGVEPRSAGAAGRRRQTAGCDGAAAGRQPRAGGERGAGKQRRRNGSSCRCGNSPAAAARQSHRQRRDGTDRPTFHSRAFGTIRLLTFIQLKTSVEQGMETRWRQSECRTLKPTLKLILIGTLTPPLLHFV